MKKKLTFSLTSKGAKKLEAQLRKITNNFEKGVDEGLRKTTEIVHQRVIDNASYNHIVNHANESYIHKEYDPKTKTGRVWSNDPVIIYNEFGTGIVGIQDEWANKFGYTVNATGRGEEGWHYPKDDGTYGFTHGLPSRHMFYDAYLYTKKQVGSIVGLEISKQIGGDK